MIRPNPKGGRPGKQGAMYDEVFDKIVFVEVCPVSKSGLIVYKMGVIFCLAITM